MNALHVLRRLRALRFAVVAALVLSIAVALAVSYRVSFDPPELAEPQQPYGTAATQIYIDSATSALASAEVVPEQLAGRAAAYAEIARTEEVVTRAARLADVPLGSFVVLPIRTRAEDEERASLSGQVPAVLVRVSSGSPILDIQGQAPTPALAARLTNGVGRALRDFVLELQQRQDVPRDRQIRLRQLGPATSAIVDESVSRVGVAALAVGIWLALVAGLLAVDALVRRARLERQQSRAEGDEALA